MTESGETMQRRMLAWSLDRWPDEDVLSDALGIAEEAGEVCRAVLKRRHGTRGTKADWTAQLRSEAADTTIVLLVLAEREGFDLLAAVAERFAEVEHRSVNHDPVSPRARQPMTNELRR